jgi:hypothetical protein
MSSALLWCTTDENKKPVTTGEHRMATRRFLKIETVGPLKFLFGTLEQVLPLTEADGITAGVQAVITDSPASQLIFDGKMWDGVLRGVTQEKLDSIFGVNLANGVEARISTETGTEVITWSRA